MSTNPWPFPKGEDFKSKSKADWPFPTGDQAPKSHWPYASEEDKASYKRVHELVHPVTTSVESYKEQDPNGRKMNDAGAKADSGKQRPWLVLGDFSHALTEVVKVGTAGAIKYTDHGWLSVPDGKARYMEAYARHALALGRGEIYDNGVGGINTKHLAQMIWNLLAALELEEREAR